MIIAVRDLPESITRALADLNYRRVDIKAEAVESAELNDYGSTGRRAFVCIVDLVSGERRVTYGSWGGPNPFNPRNAVDCDSRTYVIPANTIVIQGDEGHGPTYCRLLANPATLTPLLPAPSSLSERATGLLAVYRSYVGSYRAETLRAMNATSEELDALVDGGYLKRNKAGAISITTTGKQACEHVRYL
jgi:hypothetical protein